MKHLSDARVGRQVDRQVGARCLGYAPGLTHKHQTRLAILARDQHSSLLQKSVNYGQKKVYNIGPMLETLDRTNTLTFLPDCFVRCSTLGYAPGLTHKHQTRLAILARGKHSSLLRKSVNYGQKGFTTLATGQRHWIGQTRQLFNPTGSYRQKGCTYFVLGYR